MSNDPQNKLISQETKELIDKLLLEKLPLAGIARVADVSKPWLQVYVNRKYDAVGVLYATVSGERLLSVLAALVQGFAVRQEGER